MITSALPNITLLTDSVLAELPLMYEELPTQVMPMTVIRMAAILYGASFLLRKKQVKIPVKTMSEPLNIWNTLAVVNNSPIPESVVPPRSQHAGSRPVQYSAAVATHAPMNKYPCTSLYARHTPVRPLCGLCHNYIDHNFILAIPT